MTETETDTKSVIHRIECISTHWVYVFVRLLIGLCWYCGNTARAIWCVINREKPIYNSAQMAILNGFCINCNNNRHINISNTIGLIFHSDFPVFKCIKWHNLCLTINFRQYSNYNLQLYKMKHHAECEWIGLKCINDLKAKNHRKWHFFYYILSVVDRNYAKRGIYWL